MWKIGYLKQPWLIWWSLYRKGGQYAWTDRKFHKEMDSIRNNQVEILEIIILIVMINTGTDMKNVSDGLLIRFDIAM